MAPFKIGICEPKDFSQNAKKMLYKVGEVYSYEGDDIIQFICDKDILFLRLAYKFDDAMIAGCQKLKYLCTPTTGLNHISINRKDIRVISLKGEAEFLNSIRATPEHVFGLVIALLRNYSHAFLKSDSICFDRDVYRGYEVFHNNIGIIGMGRVGRILSGYFNVFEANVYYYDINNLKQEGCNQCDSISELIERSNVIILEADYREENKNMISKDHFLLMKNKFFVNAARGELVDEDALLSLLNDKWFSGVAIDVFDKENDGNNHMRDFLQYTKDQNLIITPHIGGATFSSMKRTEEFIAQKLISTLKKEGMINEM